MITAEQPPTLELPAPKTLERGRAVARPDHAAGPQDAALRRRADRHRAGAPARPAVPRHRAGGGRRASSSTTSTSPAARSAATPTGIASPTPGRTRAMLFLEQSHYVGVAPVPLAQYQRYMAAFKAAAPHQVTRAEVRKAFSHLVISQRVLDQLGPGRQRRPLDVRLRPARQRQDGHLAGHPQPARRRHPHSARARGRGQHHPLLRPGEPRADRRAGQRRASTSAPTAIAAGSAAGGRWSWSAASCRSISSS